MNIKAWEELLEGKSNKAKCFSQRSRFYIRSLLDTFSRQKAYYIPKQKILQALKFKMEMWAFHKFSLLYYLVFILSLKNTIWKNDLIIITCLYGRNLLCSFLTLTHIGTTKELKNDWWMGFAMDLTDMERGLENVWKCFPDDSNMRPKSKVKFKIENHYIRWVATLFPPNTPGHSHSHRWVKVRKA